MRVTDLTAGEGILCTTEEECHAILRLMHDAGLKWNSGDSYLKVHNIVYLDDGGQVYIPYEGQFVLKSMCTCSRIYPASKFIDTPTSSRDRIMADLVELSKPLKGGLGLGNKLNGLEKSYAERCNALTGDTDNPLLVETNAEAYARIRTRHSDPLDTDHTNQLDTGGSSVTNPYLNIFS